MSAYNSLQLEAAQKAVLSTLHKNEKAEQTLLTKQPPRTGQAAMIARQIDVLKLAVSLISRALGEVAADDASALPARETRDIAAREIARWIAKVEKAQNKFKPGSPQHTLAVRRVEAFSLVLLLLNEDADNGGDAQRA